MSTHLDNLSQREREVGEAIFACLEAQEAGRPVDPADVLARHPQYLTELAEFFAGRSRVERLAAPLREAVQAVSFATHAGLADTYPDLPLPDGVTSFGDYELLGEIGRGGMGVVYKARQKRLGRVVALKLLRGDTADDRQRFRREAELAATLDHPSIVPIYEVGEAQPDTARPPVPFLTMKLIEGHSLSEPRLPTPSTTPTSVASCTAT